jgi:hypothetical protein
LNRRYLLTILTYFLKGSKASTGLLGVRISFTR